MNYNEWCVQVITHLQEKNNALFQEAIKSVQENYDSPAPSVPCKQLEWMRGDEPFEAQENGDTPEQYASFLLNEWEVFGPEGE